jgi:hypothetical protein
MSADCRIEVNKSGNVTVTNSINQVQSSLYPQTHWKHSRNHFLFLAMTPSIVTSNGATHSIDDVALDDRHFSTSGYQAFDHILWYVGNAKQAASYYVTRMGFKHVAYVRLPFPGGICFWLIAFF